jgi:glycosyltransferase involved in cell wall biosynthesis
MEESFGWSAGVSEGTSLPVVTKLHGPAFLSMTSEEINTEFGQQKIAREGQALRRCSVIVSPSTSTLSQTVDRYSLTPSIMKRINNPVMMSGDTPIWRLETCNRKTILFVGRFDARKGADVLLQAFSIALRSDPELRLIFVGPDRGIAKADGSVVKFAEYCETSISPMARARIDYLGPVENHRIPSLRINAMLTVVSSRWENQGYTLLEAMFQGCPVVSTDAGGCPENVRDCISGLLAKSEDPQDFATKLLAVINDPLGAARMGREAREYVVHEHDVSKIVDESIRLYEAVIARRAITPS